jgi:hypothetical protein
VLDQVGLPVSDRERSKRVYAEALSPLGYELIIEHYISGAGFGRSGKPDFWIREGVPAAVHEFLTIIGPLTDPVSHGGVAADAFHVVAPSIPGFGFSTPVGETGWEMARTARALAKLMDRLGYERYGAQGVTSARGSSGCSLASTATMLRRFTPTPIRSERSTTCPKVRRGRRSLGSRPGGRRAN